MILSDCAAVRHCGSLCNVSLRARNSPSGSAPPLYLEEKTRALLRERERDREREAVFFVCTILWSRRAKVLNETRGPVSFVDSGALTFFDCLFVQDVMVDSFLTNGKRSLQEDGTYTEEVHIQYSVAAKD